MQRVAILLSTYNGEKFLREQLDSLLLQIGVDIALFVRDDGSSAVTREILREYAERHCNIHVQFGENLGVGNSFMELLYSVPDSFDYYAFSDQDDIWLENKLCEAVRLLQEKDVFLYASNQECVDKNGNSLGLRYAENQEIHLTPLSILERNMLAGCTMVMTNECYKVLTTSENRPSRELLYNRIHDVWVAEVASLFKGIIYDGRSFILYRQHENNIVGAYREKLGKRIKSRFKKLANKDARNGRSKLAEEIYQRFPRQCASYPLIYSCATAKRHKSKLILLKHRKELKQYTGESAVGLFFKIVFNLF